MAGFGLGNYINPGVGSFIDQRRNALAGLGAGFLNGQPGAGVQAGIQADDAYATQQRAEAERQAEIAKAAERTNATVEYFKSKGYDDLVAAAAGGAPMGNLWTEAINRGQPQSAGAQPASVQEYEFARQNGYAGSFADWMQTGKNGSAGPQLGMTPQWAQDANGNWVMTQISSDGRLQPTDTGGLKPMDPFTAAGGKTGAVVDAKTVSAARASLRGMEGAVNITRKTIDNLRGNKAGMDEQFGNILGVPQQMLPVLPQSARANFLVDLEQATGQAFMQARETLKGAGQVTDYEGRRAEAAYSKMEAASKSGDKQKFLEALDEFEQAVEAGYAKLQEIAGAQPNGAPIGGPAPSATSTGVQWSYEP